LRWNSQSDHAAAAEKSTKPPTTAKTHTPDKSSQFVFRRRGIGRCDVFR
jgi:hypothetical protein